MGTKGYKQIALNICVLKLMRCHTIKKRQTRPTKKEEDRSKAQLII